MFLKPFLLVAVAAAPFLQPVPAVCQELRLAGASLEAVRAGIAARVKARPENVDVTYWVGGVEGPAILERGAGNVMPTASAIKAFFLVELFVRHADGLDGPIPDAGEILKDDHPAVSHFPAAVRDEIRRELTSASVRRVANIMQGNSDLSNAVYNAAANLVTAHLGGPEKLTALIHARDARFKSVMVRRYMLRDRTERGDNEATAESFAALHQALASRTLKGVPDAVISAVQEVLRRKSDAEAPLFAKDGGLGSDPMTSTRAGWKQTPRGGLVFVVMARRPITQAENRSAEYEDLQALTRALRDEALTLAASPMPMAPITTHTRDSLETVRANLSGNKAVLLDVRDRDEWEDGHLAAAILVPLGQLRKPASASELLKGVPKDKVVYTHCAVGRRALDAAGILQSMGYDVRPLSDGYDELVKQGFEKAK
ncbi:rhodanese-like domain-containing protein [Caulifigura coniformis]|nr:rhodanese-like domain-containing protein [Caulifigura coniformis]